jgi:hypothetical protein
MDDKDVRLFRFDGEQGNWHGWKMAAEAYAEEKGFEAALTNTAALPTNPTAQTDLDRVEKNKKAYRFLAICCAHGKAGIYVELSKRHAGQAWKSLCDRYEPSNDADLVKLEQQFVT